jgi:hypothetical protein
MLDEYLALQANDISALSMEESDDGLTITVQVTHFCYNVVALRTPHKLRERFIRLSYSRSSFTKFMTGVTENEGFQVKLVKEAVQVGNFTDVEISFAYTNAVQTTNQTDSSVGLTVGTSAIIPVNINSSWHHVTATSAVHNIVHAVTLPKLPDDLELHKTSLGIGGITQTIIIYTATADSSIANGIRVCKYYSADVKRGQLLLVYPRILEHDYADYFEFSVIQRVVHLPTLLYGIVTNKYDVSVVINTTENTNNNSRNIVSALVCLLVVVLAVLYSWLEKV